MQVAPSVWMQFRIAFRWSTQVLSRSTVQRRFVPALAALAPLVAASRTSAADQRNPLNLPGDDFLAVFILLTTVAFGLTFLLARLVRTTGRRANIDGLSPVAIGYLVDEMPRAFDALFVSLASFGAAKHRIDWIEVKQDDPELPSNLETFRRELAGSALRKTMISRLEASRPASEMLAELQGRGLLLSKVRRRLLTIAVALPAVLVVGLGIAKIVVEWRRDRPVAILAGTCAVAAVGLLFLWAVQATAHVTWATRRALKRLRKRLGGAMKAPQDDQLALAVALAGATALTGTAYKAYADAMDPPSSSSDDGSDDD